MESRLWLPNKQPPRAMEKKLGYSIQVEKNFALMVNAVSATVAYGDLPALQDMPGVKEAYLMPTFSVPDVQATEAEITPPWAPPQLGIWAIGARGCWYPSSIPGLYLKKPHFARGACRWARSP